MSSNLNINNNNNNNSSSVLSRSVPRISGTRSQAFTRAIKPASHSVENHSNNCSGAGNAQCNAL